MKGRYTLSRSRKPIVQVAMAGFVLANLFYMLHAVGARACHLFRNLAWMAFPVLRPAILAVWQSVPAHLCEGSSFLQHLLQIVASIKPLLCLISG